MLCEDWCHDRPETGLLKGLEDVAMSDAHKEALARGRREARAIKAYLGALGHKRKPGRPSTPETLEKRISQIDEKLGTESDPLKRVDLQQKRIDAEGRLADLTDSPDMELLEKGFVESAAGYSERKGISYAAWRAEGVPAGVLRRAGIGRGR
jgi:hypothetical protein